MGVTVRHKVKKMKTQMFLLSELNAEAPAIIEEEHKFSKSKSVSSCWGVLLHICKKGLENLWCLQMEMFQV